MMAGWIVRWRALDERFASAAEALDRWERLDALGRQPELIRPPAEEGAPVAHEEGGREGPATRRSGPPRSPARWAARRRPASRVGNRSTSGAGRCGCLGRRRARV